MSTVGWRKRQVADMAKEAWEQAGEGWVHPDWFEDRSKALKIFAELVRAEALAEQPAQQEPTGMLHIDRLDKWLDASLKERKAQQEPIGVMVSMDVSKGDEPENRIFGRIYEVQEDTDGVTYLAIEESRNFITPPQRKPLTDEQIKDVAASCMWWVREQDILDDAIELARAIEAAHGIKEQK